VLQQRRHRRRLPEQELEARAGVHGDQFNNAPAA
jgi:hypothetical protein